ncbi:DVU0298 family protein [Desulfomonile tiedjei]|uniref:HEAT repeat domain-containing protein n=1 Tax=Desulfomonile tiedjei (strain ATCC 49306 / DSM 6799 / DCB-1) TaxID=706587 RepID=I4CBI0_DESTA|nr:DVU0298 family protein [Desulfomonile tiedjei]AFM26921.1 hypothetical protein Desti_4287 [Desulfomonile tiedjei DSM 6799]
MEDSAPGLRRLKKIVLEKLQADDFVASLGELLQLQLKQVTNSLFAFLMHSDERVRWRAITAMGAVIAQLAETDREFCRVIMRRLMWSLNDESGGIGWGAPETMAEIMAQHDGLAGEYNRVFVSYLNPSGNFLEYEALQRGLLWGTVRLSLVRPDTILEAGNHLCLYMESNDPIIKGCAAWAAGLLRARECVHALRLLAEDPSEFRVYLDDRFFTHSVGERARRSLSLLSTSQT